MPTSSQKIPLASTTDAKPVATTSPIQILDAPLASSVALGRPVALGALLVLGFGRLVTDPVSSLQYSVPVVAAIQVGYAATCLPVAGSSAAKGSKKLRAGERRKADGSGPNVVTSAALSLALTAFTIPFVHILFVLFGAPFLDHVSHTFLCSTHFSLLALFPTIYARGVNQQALLAVAGAYAPMDETFGALAGAVLGAWLGAVPIPLDWDREWQKWPVTIVVGMYLGSNVGSKLAGSVFWGKRMGEPEQKES